jgi:hypothetical protein
MSECGPASTITMTKATTPMTRREAINARAVTAYLISTVTLGSYVRRSGGAPALHLTQDRKWPMALDLPSAVMTQGRLLHGG